MKLWTRVVSCRNAVWEMAPDVDGMVPSADCLSPGEVESRAWYEMDQPNVADDQHTCLLLWLARLPRPLARRRTSHRSGATSFIE